MWKFFERVEAVLADQTKFEIAVWLVGRKPLGPKLEPWPETFAKVFDRVFGTTHLSWKCFGRSAITSILTMLMVAITAFGVRSGAIDITDPSTLRTVLLVSIVANIIPDYVSLFLGRYCLRLMRKKNANLSALLAGNILVTAFIGSAVLAFIMGFNSQLLAMNHQCVPVASEAGDYRDEFALIPDPYVMKLRVLPVVDNYWAYFLDGVRSPVASLWFYPAFFTCIWLWLYAGAGFILKAAQRFDIGFQWFNRKFDIEKKPLSAIGFVAGTLVAVVYWGFAVGSYLMKK